MMPASLQDFSMGLLLLLPAASAGDSASIALAAMCACIVQGFRFRSGFCCRLLLIPLVLLPPLWLNHSVPLLRLRLTHRYCLPLAHTTGSVAYSGSHTGLCRSEGLEVLKVVCYGLALMKRTRAKNDQIAG